MQLPLHEDSKQYTTINTHKELFQFQCQPFGISTAPSLFQHTMENILRDVQHSCVYIDNILISGTNEEDHLKNLEHVLQKLSAAEIPLKRLKCSFAVTSVEYLGHIIDSSGLHPSDSKVSAIQKDLAPKNITELRDFGGLLNYYHRFLPNLATVLAPLHLLL